KVYVPTYFSDTLNIVRIDSHDIKTVALNPERTMSQAQIGEKVFNDATYCFQNWQSCNGCHPGEARTDGMNWDLMNDGIGNSKNCKSLLYSIQTAPSMISGIRASAELANRKGFTHIQFSNIPEEMALAVDAYTRTLEAVASPFLVNGQLSEKAKAGSKVFEKFNCGQCHSGPYYTDMKMHRIGEDIEFEAGWDTPTLREVWRTAPYLFNGRAVTMRDVFAVYKHGIDRKISDREIDELTEYVNSL
ncbi:MAG: YVTN family beta-propeller repeat-containing protein, partial [Mucinivorans sp.]